MGFYIKREEGYDKIKTRGEYKRIKSGMGAAVERKRGEAPEPAPAAEVQKPKPAPPSLDPNASVVALCQCGCGEKITAKHPGAKYASDACRRRAQYQRKLQREGRPEPRFERP